MKADQTSGSPINVVRHQYHVLSDAEKADTLGVKDMGRHFYELIGLLGPAQGCPLPD
jgi:hypothetical protein